MCVCGIISYGFFLEISHAINSLLPVDREEMGGKFWIILDVTGGGCEGTWWALHMVSVALAGLIEMSSAKSPCAASM